MYDVLKRAKLIVSHYAEDKQVDIRAPSLMKKEFLHIFGDQHRFQQIIVNILSNSPKYSNRDSTIKLKLNLKEQKVID